LGRLFIEVVGGTEFKMVHESPRRGFDDLFPPWGLISIPESQRQDEGSVSATKVAVRDPRPREGALPLEGDLALSDCHRNVRQLGDPLAKSVEDGPRLFVAPEEVVDVHE
jgi:hypothetical protein